MHHKSNLPKNEEAIREIQMVELDHSTLFESTLLQNDQKNLLHQEQQKKVVQQDILLVLQVIDFDCLVPLYSCFQVLKTPCCTSYVRMVTCMPNISN